ncbi:hypothetical protein J8273_2815 [Carpediemonas membranifera]|uniref:Uncharacterized protein n=1 Tax=Carpediemonas membranifera TaxID=201153 RepID=A0A8J6EAX3_9EUKA|nr:hypothetical protein J8273_2815 [Carpediemonas membranifera]|eukprot:KAG9395620.1 hypothetical protein J8273_2815 [Carpediemonas membranifera]
MFHRWLIDSSRPQTDNSTSSLESFSRTIANVTAFSRQGPRPIQFCLLSHLKGPSGPGGGNIETSLNSLVSFNAIRVIEYPEEHLSVVMTTDHYVQLAKQQATQAYRDIAAGTTSIQKSDVASVFAQFEHLLLPMTAVSTIPASYAEKLFTSGSAPRILGEYGLMHGGTMQDRGLVYRLTIPGFKTLKEQIIAGRKALFERLKKAGMEGDSSVLRSNAKPLKGSSFDPSFHVLDLVGDGVAMVTAIGGRPTLRLVNPLFDV